MNWKISTILFLAIASLTVSCSKDNDVTPIDNNPPGQIETLKDQREAILLNGTWVITAFHYELVKEGEDPFITTFEDAGECYTDNVFEFGSIGDLDTDEGPSKCYSSFPQTYAGKWSIRNEGKELSIDMVPLNSLLLSSPYTFLSIEETTFDLETDYPVSGGVGHQTITFTRQ